MTLLGVPLVLSVGSGLFAAGELTTGADPFNWVTGLGFPGVIIALLITGYLRTKPEVDRLVADNRAKDKVIERKDEIIISLQTTITQQALPALARSTEVLEAIPSSETGLVAQLRQTQLGLNSAIERLERRR